MNSISYPEVTGPAKNGRTITVGVGDIVSGYTEAGKLVAGRVIATHSHYPSLTIDGCEITDDGVFDVRTTLNVSKVLTAERNPVYVGQRR